MKSPLQKILAAYQQHLGMTSDNEKAVDVFVCIFVGTFHPALVEPLWVHFIAPSGAGKTELFRPVEGFASEFIDTFTPNAFASGAQDEDGNDPSLLAILDHKVLIVKDLTGIFGYDPRLLDKLLGDLRAIYDGTYTKASGMTGRTTYRATFGMATATTDAIDAFVEQHRQLGERFLQMRLNRFPMSREDRIAFAEKAYRASEGKAKWRAELAAVVHNELSGLREHCVKNPATPYVTPEQEQHLFGLSDLLCMLRTPPVNEDFAVGSELPTRATQQLAIMAKAHAIADGRDAVNDADLKLVERVALDSLPTLRRRFLWGHYVQGKHRPGKSAAQMAEWCFTREENLRSLYMQYEHAGVIETCGGGGKLFRLTANTFSIIKQSNIFHYGSRQ